MRATWMLLGVLWLGCSVTLTPVPCQDDLHCLESQHCGAEAVCVEGARTAQMLGESCLAAIQSIAVHASECLGGSVEDFERMLGPTDVCKSVEASVAAGRQVFRPEKFGACVRALRTRSCGEVNPEGLRNDEGKRNLEAFAQGTLLEGCQAFEPQVTAGGSCANTADCQGGWCRITEACPGVCQAFIPLSGACTGLDRCQKGSSCLGGICVSDVGLDQRCGAVARCSPDSETQCENGLCIKRREAGPCENDEQCALRFKCVKTVPIQGDRSPKECRAAKAPNEACEPGAGDCGPLSYCDAGSGTCRSLPILDERCGDSNGTGDFADCLESSCELVFSIPPRCVSVASMKGVCGTKSLECGPSAVCRNRKCFPQWCG